MITQIIKRFFSIASLILITSFAGYLFAEEAIGKVIALEGKVEVKSEKDQAWKPIALKSEVYLSDTIRTGEGSKVAIFLIDETTLNLGPQTTISLDKFIYSAARNHREGKVNVFMGKVRFQVRRLFSPQSNFEVSTPTTVAGVKGTSFLVWVLSAELTRVIVMQGEVAVRNISPAVPGELRLRKNFSTEVGLNRPPSEPELVDRDSLLNLQQDTIVLKSKEEPLPAVGVLPKSTEGLPLPEIEAGIELPPKELLPPEIFKETPPNPQVIIIKQPAEEKKPKLPEPPKPPNS